MSIANLNNPSNLMTNQDVNCDDLSCNNMNAENINFQNINGVSAVISNITCDTITSKSMFISEVPPTVGTTSFLVRNPITGAIEINPNPGSGLITGATSLGSGSAVYQGQAGSSLTFNSLTGTANSIIVGAPVAGEINFNIGTNVVTLIGSQTLTNKTLISPIISTISNTGTITVPTTTGTLALVSQIPTNANYVDLTTAQTVAGAKTFSTTPLAIGTVATDRVAITTSTVSITNSSGTANISLAGGEATAGAAIRATLGAIGLYTSNASNPQLRINIPNTGISNDNSITNILGLNGTNLVFKNNIVDTSTSQTLTNKTLTSPIISTISNTGTITVPTTTGTLALVSQIPTNANYVDLTTNQSISGIKTFSTAPVISTISNGGTVTIPSGTDTLVNLAGTQTLTNKTINSANNTIQVAGTAIGSIIAGTNPLLTSSSPQFTAIGIGGPANNAYITTNDATANRKIIIWSGGLSNDHQFFGMGLNVNIFRFQVNNSGSDFVYYAGTSTTTSNEVFRIKGGGGITLPTTGGTASTLSYYETGTFSATYTVANTSVVTYRFTRIGNVVTIMVGNVSSAFGSSGYILTASGTVPARLCPVSIGLIQSQLMIRDNGSVVTTNWGSFVIYNTGVIEISPISGNFTGPGNTGHNEFSITYLAA